MESFSWVSEGPSPLKETQTVKKIFFEDDQVPGHHPRALRCPGTLFISHEHANFLFSVISLVQGEAKTLKIMGCCRAIFASLHAPKIDTFRGK